MHPNWQVMDHKHEFINRVSQKYTMEIVSE